MDEITPHSHPLSLEPNGHSKEFKAAIAAATSLVDLAKFLSESAQTLDTLDGVDRITAMAEIQIRINECAKMLAGSDNTKSDDRTSREGPVTFVLLTLIISIVTFGLTFFFFSH